MKGKIMQDKAMSIVKEICNTDSMKKRKKLTLITLREVNTNVKRENQF